MNKAFELRAQLDALYPKNHELDVGADNSALLTIIDDSFSGLLREERLNIVRPIVEAAGLKLSIAELYSPAEARERGIQLTVPSGLGPTTWDEAVSMIASGQRTTPDTTHKKPRRVVFYSYMGGGW